MRGSFEALHAKCQIRSCINLQVAARARACVPQPRERILGKVINAGRFSPPPLITRALSARARSCSASFHSTNLENSEFPSSASATDGCSSPLRSRLRGREGGTEHLRPLIRNFHQAVIRRQRSTSRGLRKEEGLSPSQFRRADKGRTDADGGCSAKSAWRWHSASCSRANTFSESELDYCGRRRPTERPTDCTRRNRRPSDQNGCERKGRQTFRALKGGSMAR